jgi:predicted aspartyl protease
MEAYLAAPSGDTADQLRDLRADLELLKASAAEPHKSCSLVSRPASAEIPFAAIKNSANRTAFFGLDLNVNNHTFKVAMDTSYNARLPIEGVSGILIRRSVAQRLGLKPLIQNEVGGVGHEGPRAGYIAYADSISIGNLEFHDCAVQVMEATHFSDGADGLIGMDILSDYLVTLDYPAEKLILSPLPARPDAGTSPNGLYNRYFAPELNGYTPVFRTGSDLIMPASVNKRRPMLFVLDTAIGPTVLSPGAAFEVVKGRRDSKYEVRDAKGMVQADYSAGDVTLNFAGISWGELQIHGFDTSKFSDDAGMEISGLIGLRTMSHMTLHIDYRDGLVKFDYDPKRTSLFSF